MGSEGSRVVEYMVDARYTRELEPLDLMAIRKDAIACDDNKGEKENPLYLWFRTSDLDEEDGWPDSSIVEEAAKLDINVEHHMDFEVPLRKPFKESMPDVAIICNVGVRSSVWDHDETRVLRLCRH